jgi:hypothetical protein
MPPKIVIKLINTYSCGDGSGRGDGGSSCGIEELTVGFGNLL